MAGPMRAPAVLLSFVISCVLGCGSSGGSSGGGGSDGKFHPPANGQPEDEGAACDQLVAAIESRFQALSCVGTTRQCPGFLTAQFGSCFQYDAGTVQGCAAHYEAATTCDELTQAITECAVATIEGSAGKGCP